MASARYTPRAEQDVRDIWSYIAVNSVTAADSLLTRIFEKVDLAATQPLMGAARKDLSPTARILVEGNYVLVYEPTADGLLVVTVVHGARNPEEWLR